MSAGGRWRHGTGPDATRAATLRALLASGRVPPQVSGPDVGATLWCGAALGSLVEGVARDEAPAAVPAGTPGAALETFIRDAAWDGPVLLDGSLAARALATLRARPDRPAPVVVRWTEADPAPGAALSASRLDVRAIAEETAARCDEPTLAAFELRCLEAMRAAAGLPRAVSAWGGDDHFGATDASRAAAARVLPRIFRRRYRPAEDAFDADAVLAAEVSGLRGAPRHRASSLAAVLGARTREALLRTGPRAAPPLARGADARTIVAAIAGLAAPSALEAVEGLVLPFASPDLRALAHAIPPRARFGAPGSGGLLATWAGVPPRRARPAGRGSDGFFDAACRGPLAPFLDDAVDLAERLDVFVPGAVREARARHRAGVGGWTGRRILVLAFLVRALARDGIGAGGRGAPGIIPAGPPPPGRGWP